MDPQKPIGPTPVITPEAGPVVTSPNLNSFSALQGASLENASASNVEVGSLLPENALNLPETTPASSKSRRWLRPALLGLALVACLGLVLTHRQSPNGPVASNIDQQYATQTLPLSDVGAGSQSTLPTDSNVNINGQLGVSGSLVLAPMVQPSSAVTGQLYYNQSTNQLSYYNGRTFVNLLTNQNAPSTQTIQQIHNTYVATGVLSLQGQTGNITLGSGGGIAISGTTISNSGVLSLGGQTGTITLGSGLGFAGGQLRNTGVVSVSAGSNISINNDGNGNLIISAAGSASGVTGSGTGGTFALWNGSGTVSDLADSLLSQSGSTVVVAGNLSATTLAGNGSGVTNVNAAQLGGQAGSYYTNASNISSGTLGDSRLSSNVALYDSSTANFTGVLQQAGNTVCDMSNNCGYLTGSAANGAYIQLQTSTPGTAQTGNLNISGTGIFGSVKGTSLYQNGNQVCDTSGNCGYTGSGSGAGVASVNTLVGDLTLQGTAGQIAFASGGSTITASLNSNVTLLGQSIALGSETTGNYQQFTTAGDGITVSGSASPGSNPTVAVDSTVCRTTGNCVGTGSGGSIGGGGTANTIALITGTGYTIGNSLLTQDAGATTVTVGGNVSVNGSLSATSLSGNGSGVTSVNAAQLGGQAGSYYTDAGNINTGTLSNSRLSINVTLQGNTFNGASQLLQLNASGLAAVANGGTGVNGSTAANGQLLIGNGSGYTLANITAGSGVSIANAAGSITLSVDGTVCRTGGGCAATGNAGGDLSGTYPNPTVVGLQGKAITLTSLAINQLLVYNGTTWVNALLNNANLSSGTYGNITGVGTLTTGSIGSGFGTISTGSNITTTATLQGATVNATTGFGFGGTAGSTFTCSSGNLLQNAVLQGGIVTGGSCAAASGVTTVGAFSSVSQPNGASISGNTITFGPADGTNPGMVSTGTQTFAGNKTFTGTTTVKNNSTSGFQIQNATTGTAIMNVDSTNGIVQIRTTNDTSLGTTGSELFTVGFNAATGWTTSGTGNSATATHTSGSGTAYITSSAITGLTLGTVYQFSCTVSAHTGTYALAIFNSAFNKVEGSAGDAQTPPTSCSGDFVADDTTVYVSLAPGTSSFNGTISNISLKQALPTTAAFQLQDSSGAAALEIRSGGVSSLNTFIGLNAGEFTISNGTSGTQNVAVGASALQGNTQGSGNTAVGTDALLSNTSGLNNSAFGGESLQQNTTGGGNVAFGTGSLAANTTGSNNVAIGYEAGNCDNSPFCTASNLQYSAAIGAFAQVQANNTIVLGSVDFKTQIVIGATVPVGSNLFGVSPMDINSYIASTTATQTNGSNVVTASTAIFSSSNIGEELVWEDGTTETITGFTSTTKVTVSRTNVSESAQYFRTHYIGFQVTNTGNAYVQNTSTTAFQVQNAAGTQVLGIDTTNGAVLITSTGNSTIALEVTDSTGSPVIVVDAANHRLGINTASPGTTLSVNGGNNVNPNWPDGMVGTPISATGSSPSYTVPTGKTLYVTSAFCSGGTGQLWNINGVIGGNCTTNGSAYPIFTTSLSAPTPFAAGTAVTMSGGTGTTQGFMGLLVSAGVTPVSDSGSLLSYTVPTGKILYITSAFCSGATGAWNINTVIGGNCATGSAGGTFTTALTGPTPFAAGTAVTMSSSSVGFAGYLTNSNGLGGP